jgi:hypothetical protein
MDIKILEACVRANVRPWTFAEAYDRTGRIINIIVSPSRDNKDAPRLLNYLTAPNVVRLRQRIGSPSAALLTVPVRPVERRWSGLRV